MNIFEKVLRYKFFHGINQSAYPGKHHFRAGKSYLSQLLDYSDKTIEALEKEQNPDVIYTNIAKAFDRLTMKS